MTVALIPIDVLAYLLSSQRGFFLPVLLDVLLLALLGPSVEGALGRARFGVFCLLVGVLALAIRALAGAGSTSPVLFGASVAIAAVLGGYLPLHPRGRVLTVVLVPFSVTLVEIPAVFLIGLWIALQLYFSASGLNDSLAGSAAGAYLLPFGGFALGLAVTGLLAKHRRATPPPHAVY